MLLEIPYTLTEGGRITSKTVKRLYYEYERNVNPSLFSTLSNKATTIRTSFMLQVFSSEMVIGKIALIA